jgi:bifunctional non-homologous end joining protein LigD
MMRLLAGEPLGRRLGTGGHHRASALHCDRRAEMILAMNGSTGTAMPQSIAPMLATAGELPTDDDNWAFEFKWDGIRAVSYVENGEIRFVSRNDNDLTGGFGELQAPAGFLGFGPAVLDGEIVAFDDTVVPSFQLLQPRIHGPAASAVQRRAAAYLVFDVVFLHGTLLLDEPYSQRRLLLEQIGVEDIEGWAVAPSFPGPGVDVFGASIDQGLEGLVAKRLDSRYTPGRRSPAWIKVKHVKTQEVVLGGWTRGGGNRSGTIGALLLGIPGHDGLEYVGKVGSGFDFKELAMLGRRFAGLVADRSPFSTLLSTAEARSATWVRPELVAEVTFTGWTNGGRLRHPVWRGLRLDKSPADVTLE